MTERLFYPACKDYDRVTPFTLPAADYALEHMSWEDQFGSSEAVFKVHADAATLVSLYGLLGMTLEIYDRDGGWWWTGRIQAVQTTIDGVTAGLSLDDMANEVATAYSTGGESKTTAYLRDAGSYDYFKFAKQHLESMTRLVSATTAEGRRAILLQELAWPLQKRVSFAAGAADGATLELVGLGKTLADKAYSCGKALISNTTNADAGGLNWMTNQVTFGHWYEKGQLLGVAQQFTVPAKGLWLSGLGMHIGENGVTQGVTLTVRENGVHPTGSIVATTAASHVPGAYATMNNWAPTASVWLPPLKTYWLRADADKLGLDSWWVATIDPTLTGAQVNLDGITCGSSGGPGPGWVGIGSYPTDYHPEIDTYVYGWPGGGFLYNVHGFMEQTDQIEAMIEAQSEFIVAVDVLNSSGKTTTPYRNDAGASQVLDQVLALLNDGTTNERRLLARVTRARHLQIYEEPAKPLSLDLTPLHYRRGQLFDREGHPVWGDPCGQWVFCDAYHMIPFGVKAHPGLFEVQGASMSGDGVYTLTPRNARDPLAALITPENG